MIYDEDSATAALSEPDADLNALSDEFEEQALGPFRAAARLANDPDSRVAGNGRALLAYGVEAALRSMWSLDGLNVGPRMQFLRAVVSAEMDARTRTEKWLEQQMADKTLIPLPDHKPAPDPKPVPRRVCDEAFLAMRRLNHPDDDPIQQGVDASLFENMPDAEKDAVIAEARAKRDWRPPQERYLPPEDDA